MTHLETELSDRADSLVASVESGAALVVCPEELAPALRRQQGFVWLDQRQEVHLLTHPKVELAASALEADGLVVQILLDQVLLVARPTHHGHDMTRLHADLFDLVGGCYDLLIDRERNRDNITQLLAVMPSTHRNAGPILDFGCGSGISLEVQPRPRDLVGWDRSARMRSLAASNGLQVLDVLAADHLPAGTFAAALASYVFDLPTAPQSIPAVLRSLHPGGVLVANLHRDRNLDAVVSLAKDSGAVVHKHDRDPRHGSILVIRTSE